MARKNCEFGRSKGDTKFYCVAHESWGCTPEPLPFPELREWRDRILPPGFKWCHRCRGTGVKIEHDHWSVNQRGYRGYSATATSCLFCDGTGKIKKKEVKK